MLEIQIGRLAITLRAPVVIYRYHPLHKPVPRGWEVADDFGRWHHGEYAVLIRKKGKHHIYRVRLK